jgi:hypothetical protein
VYAGRVPLQGVRSRVMVMDFKSRGVATLWQAMVEHAKSAIQACINPARISKERPSLRNLAWRAGFVTSWRALPPLRLRPSASLRAGSSASRRAGLVSWTEFKIPTLSQKTREGWGTRHPAPNSKSQLRQMVTAETFTLRQHLTGLQQNSGIDGLD